jgi:hypothetical protein
LLGRLGGCNECGYEGGQNHSARSRDQGSRFAGKIPYIFARGPIRPLLGLPHNTYLYFSINAAMWAEQWDF